MPSVTTTDVCIIGSGLVGASTAHALTRRGVGRVVVVDRDTAGSGDSGLTFGMVRRHYTNPVLIRLAMAGTETLMHWDEQVGVGASGYVPTGYLLPGPERLAETCRAQVATQRELGLETSFLEPAAIADVEPIMSLDGVAGAAYEPAGGVCDSRLMIGSWLLDAQARGLELRQRARVAEILMDGERATGVRLADGEEIHAGLVLVAAGGWSPELLAPIWDVPIALSRIQVAVLRQAPGEVPPAAVTSDAVSNVVVRSANGRDVWVVAYQEGTPPIEGRDDCQRDLLPGYEDAIRHALRERFPSLARSSLVGGWGGAYDSTPDWHPLVGPVPGTEGLWICAGWSGHGLKSTPAIGRCVADLLTGSAPEVDIADLAPDRFSRGLENRLAYGPGARA
jgi:glycine/D-amino acid oxidase-like deaminating enzyme